MYTKDLMYLRDTERDLCLESLFDTFCRKRGPATLLARIHSVHEEVFVRNEDGGCGSSSLLDGLLYGREHGLAEMLLSSLLGICASDDICAWIEVSVDVAPLGQVSSRRIPYSMAC
jgi:hypothetical protein